MNEIVTYRSVSEQAEELANIIRQKDLKCFKKGIWDVIKLVVFKDPTGMIEDGFNTADLLFHLPTALFWDKMERFLKGTYYNFEDQVKFAEKFEEDNNQYVGFVKRLLSLIDLVDTDEKVNYVANLTRCFLLYGMEKDLYFRLAKFIQDNTAEEILFLKNMKYDQHMKNDSRISLLILQGIIIQEQDEKSHTSYVLSSFGKALKKCSLNFSEDSDISDMPLEYDSIDAIEQMEPMTWEQTREIVDSAFGN